MDLFHIIAQIQRHVSSEHLEDLGNDEQRMRQAKRRLALPPHDVTTAQKYMSFYRMTDLISRLTNVEVDEISAEGLRSWARRLLLIAHVAFNGTCGTYIQDHTEGRLRLDICAITCKFPCSKCSRRGHSLETHLWDRFGAQLRYKKLAILEFPNPGSRPLHLTLEQTWVGIIKLPNAIIYPPIVPARLPFTSSSSGSDNQYNTDGFDSTVF
ncbi:hypothetical protein Aduo_018617 [Ancylostoma duodenale]